MNIIELQKKLLAAARMTPPSDHAPYAFGKRIMAHLLMRPSIDVWTVWGIALWRAALPCIAIMFLTVTWIYFVAERSSSATPLAIALENTVLASVDNGGYSW
jgi:hypothetical protein